MGYIAIIINGLIVFDLPAVGTPVNLTRDLDLTYLDLTSVNSRPPLVSGAPIDRSLVL